MNRGNGYFTIVHTLKPLNITLKTLLRKIQEMSKTLDPKAQERLAKARTLNAEVERILAHVKANKYSMPKEEFDRLHDQITQTTDEINELLS